MGYAPNHTPIAERPSIAERQAAIRAQERREFRRGITVAGVLGVGAVATILCLDFSGSSHTLEVTPITITHQPQPLQPANIPETMHATVQLVPPAEIPVNTVPAENSTR